MLSSSLLTEKKSAVRQVSSQQKRHWEKFDIEIVKREQLQKEISLADQIRFAKNRRADYSTQEAFNTLYPRREIS